jgi:cullin 3
VLKEREFLIDAAIIRIMKSRRVLDYNGIQTETKKLITMFVPDPLMIKRRIESLCEREYMKRDETDK